MQEHGYYPAERIHIPSPDDKRGIIRVLTRAFDADPAVNWVIRKDDRRSEAINLFFQTCLTLCFQRGEVFRAPSNAGAALWYPPGKWEIGYVEQAIVSLWMARAVGLRGIVPLFGALGIMEKNHPKEGHFFLDYIGVDLEHQDKGIGSALLKPVLDRCDREGCGAYLVNSNTRNFDFYTTHGFEVLREIRLGKGSPALWPMWRKHQ